MKKLVVITSKNPVKIDAVKNAFKAMLGDNFVFDVESVSSGVPDQPMCDFETLTGAQNRVVNAKAIRQLDSVFYVAIEGGIHGGNSYAWVVIEYENNISKTRSATIQLPPAALEMLNDENELGDVMDKLFDKHNSKQAGGCVGLLTDNVLNRSDVYTQAVTLALAPFKNPTQYSNEVEL